jgi:phenylpropionate dioxygenase-like ring-hydroxylating dioxygenase large terminal subunit
MEGAVTAVEAQASEMKSGRAKLASYFHPVAPSEEITERPAPYRLLDEEIVLFRLPSGEVECFKDLCLHRGTRLSLGSVTSEGNLRCVYHGWEYDRTGQCVRIPALPEGASIPRKARAWTYHVREAYGLVWVALDDPVADVPVFPENEWDDPTRHNFRPIDQTWRSSAGRAIENFCDWAHLPWLHPDRLGPRNLVEVQPYDVWSTDTQLGYTMDQVVPQADVYSEGVTRNIYWVTLPFTVHLRRENLEGGTNVMLMLTASPTTAGTCRVFMLNSRNHTLDPEADPAFKAFSEQLFDEDRMAVESQRPEEIPISLREELHLKVPDAFSVVYRRLLAEFGEEGDAFLEV